MKKKYFYIIIILLIIACIVAFGRTAGNDFINFDDPEYIIENNHVQSGINIESVKWAFTSLSFYYWHPLTWLSHMLDWSLFGAGAGGHHLVSLLLHICGVILLFLFLNKTTKSLWPSAFAAALFALHPLRVESIAWASERKDVLSMFFGMATLYAYSFYAESAKLSRYFLCLILFALSLMSKPMMVTLPFVLLLLDYWPLKRWRTALDERRTGKLVLEKIPFVLLTTASSIITIWGQTKYNAVASLEQLPFITRIENVIVSYTAYLWKILFPLNLAVYYPYKFYIPLWKVLISAIIIILITIVVLYYIRKLPFLFVGWFWYLGTLIPLIGFIQAGMQSMADRHTYMPFIGIAIMLTWGIPLLLQREDIRKKFLFPAGVTVITILAVLTWQQCGYWKNSITIFSHALHITKDNYLAHGNLASALAEKGRFNEAVYHYKAAIRIIPYNADDYKNRGLAYAALGQYHQTIEDCNEAIRLKPDCVEAYLNRGAAYGALDQYDSAIDDLNKAIRLNPDYVEAYYNRGTVYAKIGQYKLAIENYTEAIRLRPDYTGAYYNRGISYMKLNQYQRAISDFKEIIRMNPDSEEARQLLISALEKERQKR